jgi:chemotaxis protein MotB
MSGKKALPPLRIRTGAEEWLTSFADMMTLLLIFFILLYSTAQVESKKVFEMQKSFEKYFDIETGSLGYSSNRVKLEKIPDVLADLGTPESGKTSDEGRSLERTEAEIIDRYASLSKEESHHLIILQGTLLFAPGSAEIREEAKPSLLRIAARLQRYSNRIKILGHTSPFPLDPALGTDHEGLGYLRAKAVGKFLSGGDGDLGELARKLLPYRSDRIVADIFSIDPARFVFASRGCHSPASSNGKLWEDIEKNDRVELVFLPEFVAEAEGR